MKNVMVRSWNNKDKSQSFEEPTGNSLTIPDKALTVAQIMENHTRGIPTAMRDPLYQFVDLEKLDDKFDEVDISTMDKQDLLMYGKAVEEQIEEIRSRMQERNMAREEALKKEQEALIEEGKKARKKASKMAAEGEKAPSGT